MNNSIFEMLNGNNTNNLNNVMGLINGRFGNLGNAMRQLNAFINNKGLTAEQLVMENIKGKTFSKETIEQFREFARQSGMSDEVIDDSLRRIGVIS